MTKVNALELQTLAGRVDVSDFEGESIDQYLKVEENNAVNAETVSNEVMLALIITGIVILLIGVSVFCYLLRRKRVRTKRETADTASPHKLNQLSSINSTALTTIEHVPTPSVHGMNLD